MKDRASGGGGGGGYRQECLFIENDEMTTAVKALWSTDFDINVEQASEFKPITQH